MTVVFSSILNRVVMVGGPIFNPDRSLLLPVLGVCLYEMPVARGLRVGHGQCKLCREIIEG